jgi:integrase
LTVTAIHAKVWGETWGVAKMGKLNPAQVKNLKAPGRYVDGGGLMLEVKPSGSKSWVVRLQSNGRRRDFGLGSFKDVGLSEARELAGELRKTLRQGIDPVAARHKKRSIPTFEDAAKAVHDEHKHGWRNGKHREQWLATLKSYAFPSIGQLRVDAVGTGQVRDLLAEIWLLKPETARRVRQRIGTVLDYAHGKGWREPFLMTAVNKSLPRQPRKTGQFAAMPYAEVPAFLGKLRDSTTSGRLALQALILTAARSGEVRGAKWTEIDFEAATWTVPADRMKAGKEHVIPLSDPAICVLRRAAELRIGAGDLVFPGAKRGRPLSDMTLLKVLRDMNVRATVHGFRSAFRDWCAEQTSISGEVAEAALAHAIPNKVEAAYRRTTFFEKRRQLMEAWASYCSGSSANVVRLASA